MLFFLLVMLPFSWYGPSVCVVRGAMVFRGVHKYTAGLHTAPILIAVSPWRWLAAGCMCVCVCMASRLVALHGPYLVWCVLVWRAVCVLCCGVVCSGVV